MAEAPSLEELGLTEGEQVRWKRRAGSHWSRGAVIRRENDGSVAVRDCDGSWRSIPIEQLQVQGLTSRGTRRWQPLTERAGTDPQLRLW